MADRRIKAIIEAQDRATPVFKRIATAAGAFAGVLATIGVANLGRKLAQELSNAVKASADYESAVTRLAVALANQGQNTEKVREGLVRYASELQTVSIATENQILSALAQAKSFGASDEAARKSALAATELAAALGVDLGAAFRLVNRTLAGYTGELGELVPEVKELTEEQRKAGAAADIILQKFRGAGEQGAKTFTGSVNNLNSELERLRRQLGGPFREVFTQTINNVFLPFARGLNSNETAAEHFRIVVIDTAVALVHLGRVFERVVRSPAVQAGFHVALALGRLELERLEKGLKSFAGLAEAELSRIFAPFGGLGDSPFSDDLLAALDAIRNGTDDVGANVQNIANNAREVNQAFQETELVLAPILLTLEQAAGLWIDFGDAAENELARINASVETLEQALDRALRDVAVSSALRLGDTLVDAATGAEASFKAFFKQLLKDIAKAIVQALILKAIVSSISPGGGGGDGGFFESFFGFGFGFKDGGLVPRAQSGLIARGGVPGRDSVPILATPGEAVLPKDLTDFLLSAAGGGTSGSMSVTINAVDARSIRQMLEDNPDAFAAGMRRATLSGAL